MQARPKIFIVFIVALIVSLALFFYGRGRTDRTWFNLPSLKVNVQPDGSARIFGVNPGPVLPATLVQQLQSVNVQKLDVRVGANGLHIYANGTDLPYLKWDQQSFDHLREILPQLPVPNAQLIADYLPWARTLGLGAALHLPPGEGQAVQNIPRWRGETVVRREQPQQLAIGPLTIGSLAFDDQGNAIIEGVPASALAPLGVPAIQLPPNILALLQNIGAETMQVAIQPNGIDLSLNGEPLPSIAYDSRSLAQLQTLLPAFVQDPALVDTLNQVIPLLPATQATVAVSFTGEQAAETQLPRVAVNIQEDGRMAVQNIPVGAAPLVPADTVQMLQGANIQRLDVSLQPDGLLLAANGQALPSVTWTGDSLATVAAIAGPLTGLGAEGITSVINIATGLGPQATINVPPAAGTEPISITEGVTPTIQPVEANPQAAALSLTATVDGQGNLTALGGLTAEELSGLGVTLPALPANIVDTLRSTGAQQVQLDTEPGVLHVRLDGQDALAINYDTASLQTALGLAAAISPSGPLADPAVNQLLRDVIVPQAPAANVDIVLTLQ